MTILCFFGCWTSENCTVCSRHKESNILKHKKQITGTITNCYRRNIGLSNDFPISPLLFWSVFFTSIVEWVLAFVKTQHYNIYDLIRSYFQTNFCYELTNKSTRLQWLVCVKSKAQRHQNDINWWSLLSNLVIYFIWTF